MFHESTTHRRCASLVPRDRGGRRRWTGLLAAAILAQSPLCAAQDEAIDARKKAEAIAALSLANQTKNRAKGQEPEQRFEILKAASLEFEEVGTRFPEIAEVCGEAWFRAGEVHRILRRIEEAQRCFEQAAGVTANPSFGARALAELAHIDRRAQRLPEALARYEAVEKQFPGERQQGVRARTWQGKVLLSLNKTEEGHRRLLSVGEDFAEFPVEHVRNTDLVAVDWCEADRTDEARALVEALRQRYAEGPEDEKLRAAVVKAMEKMKAPNLIASR